MFSHKTTRTAVILALTASVPLVAQAFGPKLARYDTDGDGRVTREEVQAARLEEFRQADTNSDGNFSLEEMQALREQKKGERFESLDSDASGSISEAEFLNAHPHGSQTAVSTVFGFADSDSDKGVEPS
jgi:Ca2+-binding EF-hand superfamily protein